MPQTMREVLLASLELKRFTPQTITCVGDLNADLRAISRRGYAVDNEEYTLGVRCCAAPIHDHSGCVVAAVSVTSLAARLPPERVSKQGELVVQACLAISVGLGYQKPKHAMN
jgi:DNA-binding IclR family transcriptional regulator